MNLHHRTLVLALVIGGLVATGNVQAQDPPPPAQPTAPPAARRALVPLEIEVVISRHRGDTLVSRAPYVLAVNANSPSGAQLNMGAEVPVPTTTFTPTRAEPAPAAGDTTSPADAPPSPTLLRSFTYRPVGASITCTATETADGRYEVQLSVDDTWVYSGEQRDANLPLMADQVVFRNFRSRNTLLLRDGQSRQYTVATERVTGEVVRVEVTLRVVN